MFKWGNMVVGFEDAEYQTASGSPLETQQQGGMNLRKYCARLALERRGGTGEDLLTVLGNAELNGTKLTELQLMHNGFLYIIDGLETTRNAISGGLLALIQHRTLSPRRSRNRFGPVFRGGVPRQHHWCFCARHRDPPRFRGNCREHPRRLQPSPFPGQSVQLADVRTFRLCRYCGNHCPSGPGSDDAHRYLLAPVTERKDANSGI